ncbi:MAG: LysE family transporter [Nitrospirota bacterium]
MEQNFLVFLLSAVIISLSGVLSPGPMTAAAIQQGSISGLTGIFIALGHGVVEMPLIFIISLGAGSILQLDGIRIFIGIAGGIYLLFMGKNLLRVKKNAENIEVRKTPSSFFSGIILSIGNPYFLLWWGTVGAGLVFSAARFGTSGLFLFAIAHWFCDLLWYSFLSLTSFKGIKMLGARIYAKVSLLCGAAMLFYGGIFIVGSFKILL